jgi:putative transposase
MASLIDCATREVIGYAMAEHVRTTLVLDALDMAMRNRRLEADCIMHSDRGTQYTSTEYREKLVELGLRHSVGRTRSMLGQRARGIVFRDLEERAHPSHGVPDTKEGGS